VGGTAAAGVSILRILIVSQAFPPYNTSGAVRVGKLATYLLARGHDVRVLTASPLPYPQTLEVETPVDRIVKTPSADPFAYLANRRPRRVASSGTPRVRPRPGSEWRRRILRALGAIVAIPEPQIGWYP